jgi:DNA-binding Lrp family transcriptional regulator
MDSTDMKIAILLGKDARRSYRDLSKETGLSITGTRRRIKKLEQAGVIKGYVAVVDEKRLGNSISAFLVINGDSKEITNELQRSREIREVYKITGNNGILAKLYAPDVTTLSRVVENLKQAGAKSIDVSVVLDEIKNEGVCGQHGASPAKAEQIGHV